jgi:hypothetical protein
MIKQNLNIKPPIPDSHKGVWPKGCRREQVFIEYRKYGYACTISAFIIWGSFKARQKALEKFRKQAYNWFYHLPVHEIIKADFVTYTTYVEVKARQTALDRVVLIPNTNFPK